MACTADRHGNESAYRQGCRCPEARDDRRTRQKLRDAGLAKPAYTDTIGTQRRLQALGALGWTAPDLAGRLDTPAITVKQARMGTWPRVRSDFAARVSDLYEELQGTPGPSGKARTWAAKSGWAPPLLWDDRNIDDPAARPVRDEPARGPRVDLGEVQFLESFGQSRDAIAKQLGVRLTSIERAEFRAQARARDTVPVWVPAPTRGDTHALAR